MSHAAFKRDATGYWIAKDPEDTLDYTLDWSVWLNGDTIATSVWTVPAGLTLVSDSNTTTGATVKVSGGTAGTTYTLENKITTAGGRTVERSFRLVVKER